MHCLIIHFHRPRLCAGRKYIGNCNFRPPTSWKPCNRFWRNFRKNTRHARPYRCVNVEWSVRTPSLPLSVSFLALFSFYDSFSMCPGRTSADRSAPNLACKCGFGQGCAFSGSRWWPITFTDSDPPKNNFGAWIGIASQIYKKNANRHIFQCMHRISIKFEWPMQPNE